MSPSPFVSVIIPVFNDAERLRICLQALERQTYPRDRYEVIVVDNGSDDDLQPAVAPYPQAILLTERRPGSYAARNAGIAKARGDMLAFTDADCIPDRRWIELGVARFFAADHCGLVAGQIELFFQNPSRPTAVELYDSIKIGFPQADFVAESHYGATANLFTAKAVVEAVGHFDDSLKSSGDREWGQRVFAAGYGQVYAEEVRVAHPARHTWRQLRVKVARVTGGHLDLARSRGVAPAALRLQILRDSIKDMLPPVRMYFYIWSYDRLKTHWQRLQFTAAMLFVRYVRSWERLRLVMGGSSKRA